MKVAVALGKDRETLYPGPFGHAAYYALVEDCRVVEVIENPYAREEGGNKPAKLKVLLAGAERWIGRRFGHDDPDHHHHHHHEHGHHGPPPVPTQKTEAKTLIEVLEELGCASTT